MSWISKGSKPADSIHDSLSGRPDLKELKAVSIKWVKLAVAFQNFHFNVVPWVRNVVAFAYMVRTGIFRKWFFPLTFSGHRIKQHSYLFVGEERLLGLEYGYSEGWSHFEVLYQYGKMCGIGHTMFWAKRIRHRALMAFLQHIIACLHGDIEESEIWLPRPYKGLSNKQGCLEDKFQFSESL